jgi:pimeloyl-ACP methyl ester carboxylesterase
MATMHTALGTVSYTDEGSGPPIVLLHAALHDRTDYAPVAASLAQGRRVLALDWPGHGESPRRKPRCARSTSVMCSSNSQTNST